MLRCRSRNRLRLRGARTLFSRRRDNRWSGDRPGMLKPLLDARNQSELLSLEWAELCSRYLPITRQSSIWRFSRAAANLPEQGWKIHVSATVLNAGWVLRRIAPFLQSHRVYFKAPVSLEEVKKINSGVSYGYAQVGKLITIYPQDKDEAAALAPKLYELIGAITAPTIPFDQRFRPDGCIYFRYGAFRHLELENADGTRSLALRRPDGQLCPDARDASNAKPEWLPESLFEREEEHSQLTDSPLTSRYRVFKALGQRGKGGVYLALDLGNAGRLRLCVLKEGRRGGELGWDGCDGFRRVKNEETVLKSLKAAGIDVPAVYGSFTLEGNYYLATEFIEGENLQAFLLKRQRRISIDRSLRLGVQLASILVQIRQAGWIWRDCKPANLILTNTGKLRPFDFEGACRVSHRDAEPWSTPGFAPVSSFEDSRAGSDEDLYGLGATLYYLITGRRAAPVGPAPINRYRRRIPKLVSEVIAASLGQMSTSLSLEMFCEKLQHALRARV